MTSAIVAGFSAASGTFAPASVSDSARASVIAMAAIAAIPIIRIFFILLSFRKRLFRSQRMASCAYTTSPERNRMSSAPPWPIAS